MEDATQLSVICDDRLQNKGIWENMNGKSHEAKPNIIKANYFAKLA